MDKYEYNLRLEQMKSLSAERSYQKAAEIADTINWRKIKNATALARAGEIYEQVGRYDESRELFLMAKSRSPMGRNILYRLVCVSVELEKYDEAWGYYKEFVEVAPRDNLKYVLKYKISKAERADYQTLILCLEDLKEQEPTEEWGYELAYLYHKAEMASKCVEACDELFLYFGYGTYVEKALELKMLYQPLSPQQEESYQKFKQKIEIIKEAEPENAKTLEPEKILESEKSATEAENFSKQGKTEEESQIQNLQAVLQKGMQKFMGEVKKEELAQSRMNAIKRLVKDIPGIRQKEEKQTDSMTEYLKQRELETMEKIPELLEQPNLETMEKMSEPLEQIKIETMGQEIKPLEQKELKMVRWEKQTEVNEKEEIQEGQIRIVLPNGQIFESRITGEMSFNEIMSEWEHTMQIAASALKEEQTRQKSMKEKASQEAGDILERLIDVIPGANTGQRPKPVTVKEKKFTVLEEKNEIEKTEETEMAAQMVADMNQILQKEIERISTENAQIEERIVEVQESVNITQKDTIQESAEHQELAAEIHAVMKQQDGLFIEKDAVLEEREKPSENVLEEITSEDEMFVNTFDDIAQEEHISETFLQVADVVNKADIQIEESKSEEIPIEIEAEEMKSSEPEEPSFEEILEEPKMKEIQKEKSPFREEPDEEFLVELSQELIGRLEESTEELIPEIKFPEDINLEIELTELSPEQKEIFSYITNIKGMEEQICIALSGIVSRLKEGRKSNIGNLIIMGNAGSGKTVFATNFIKVLQQITGKLDGRIGKIEASILNEKDINSLFEKIAGGCLIIENAGNLTQESTRILSLLLEEDMQGTLVILEGLKHEIEKVLMRDKEFASKFSERIKIPIFTNDELVIFARAYARECGYVIDDMGILALYNSIGKIKKLGRETTIAEVKELVDAAIANAESGALKKAFSIFTSSRFNEEDYVILREKDFN